MRPLSELEVGKPVMYVREVNDYRGEFPAHVITWNETGVLVNVTRPEPLWIPWGDRFKFIADPAHQMQAYGPVVEDGPLEGTVPELE